MVRKDAAAPNPRAVRTREALLGAGITLLSERSIDAIAIDELVDRAGVGKGSFFNHFADKPSFAAAVASVIRLEIEAWVAAANRDQQDAVLRLAAGLATAAAYGLANPARARTLLRTTSGAAPAEHPLNAGLRADLEAAGRSGQIAAPADSASVLFWLACCQAAMDALLARPGEPASAIGLLHNLLTLGLRGLGAAPTLVEQAADPERLRRLLERRGPD